MTLDENSEIVSAQEYYPYGEITATGLCLIDAVANGGPEKEDRFQFQAASTGINLVTGRMTSPIGERVTELSKSIDWKLFDNLSPYLPSLIKWDFRGKSIE